MKIHVLSDLHLETGAYQLPEGLECDVVAAVGDIGLGTAGVEFLTTLPWPVVYVAGNHEFWPLKRAEGDDGETPIREDYNKRLRRIRAAARGTNVHVLDCDAVVIDGVRFLGATLWTDYGRGNPSLMDIALQRMRDSYKIGADHWYATEAQREAARRFLGRMNLSDSAIKRLIAKKLFLPLHAHALHRKAVRFLRRELAQPFAGETVVLTHHAPTFEALTRSGIEPRFLDHKSWTPNEVFDEHSRLYRVAAYASNLDALLAQYSERINLWCFGHIHHALDFVHEGVRLVSNPRGYYYGPLTAESARAMAFFGVPVSEDDIAKSNAHFAAHPYEGDGVGFDPDLVIDLEAGLEPLLARNISRALEAVRPLKEELDQFAAHVLHHDVAIRTACQEAVHARATQITQELLPVALEALKAIGIWNRYETSGAWALNLVGLGMLYPGRVFHFPIPGENEDPDRTQTVLAAIRGDLTATERNLQRLSTLPQKAHCAVRKALITIMQELEARGVKIAVRGWATRRRVRRLPPNYWVADLCTAETRLQGKSEQLESEDTDTEIAMNNAIYIQNRFSKLIGAHRAGWRAQLQIAVYDTAHGSADNTERWMTLTQFEDCTQEIKFLPQ